MNPSGAVVVGAHVAGLTVARALARDGIPVVVLRTRDWDMAHVSRAASESVDLRQFSSTPEALFDLLIGRREDWRGWAVYPTDDQALESLLDHRETLYRHGYRVIVPPEDAAAQLLDKARTMQLARRLGVDLPHDYGELHSSEMQPDALRYPVVLKPDSSHRFREIFPGKKLFLANDASQFEAARSRLTEAELRAHVLDFIKGPDSLFFNFSVYMTSEGVPLAGFPMRKLRKSPPFFGVCRVAHTEVSAQHAKTMEESVVAMLRAIGYRGMANAEFKLDDRDGRLRLMEINARPFLMQGLPLRTGRNYPRMAWQDFVTGDTPRFDDNGWRGAWIHLHADIGNAVAYRRSENLRLRDYLNPYLQRHTYAVLSARDPAPFLLQWGRTLFGAGRARQRREPSHHTVPRPIR